MFDSGSQRSFVSGKVAQKAGVPVKRKEWVEIRKYGQEKVEGKLREVFEWLVAPVQGGERRGAGSNVKRRGQPFQKGTSFF
jgi:hypothetical protein